MKSPKLHLNTNRDFYNQNSQLWHVTRQNSWPGWDILWQEYSTKNSQQPINCLDLGCGNLRFLKFLLSKIQTNYWGIDFSKNLLNIGKQNIALDSNTTNLSSLKLKNLDLTNNEKLQTYLTAKFDLVTIFALLQHVPEYEQRLIILKTAKQVLKPQGEIWISSWNFPSLPNFAKKIVEKLSETDYLLKFAESAAPRFVHYLNQKELVELSSAAELKVISEFDSDGRTGKLNHYLKLISC